MASKAREKVIQLHVHVKIPENISNAYAIYWNNEQTVILTQFRALEQTKQLSSEPDATTHLSHEQRCRGFVFLFRFVHNTIVEEKSWNAVARTHMFTTPFVWPTTIFIKSKRKIVFSFRNLKNCSFLSTNHFQWVWNARIHYFSSTIESKSCKRKRDQHKIKCTQSK